MKHARRFLPISILTLGVALGWGSWATSEAPREPADLQAFSAALGDLADRVQQATVYLEVQQGATGRGVGTGFVIDAVAGIVVTNAHVVRDAPKATVRFGDGREVNGDVLGTDPLTDLAVLDIPPGAARSQLQWGDSDAMRPGHMVMAVGSPLRLRGTTSLGIVSALGRELEITDDGYEDFMQHDAFIDRGSSGGPLVNMDGKVIGINTAIGGEMSVRGEDPPWRGISYAVPSALARRFVEDIIQHGEVRRGWIGVKCRTVDASRAGLLGLERPYGAEVETVVAGGPAEAAGIRPGDVILEIDGREVRNALQIKTRIAAEAPGTEVKVKLLSKRSLSTVRVKLGELGDKPE